MRTKDEDNNENKIIMNRTMMNNSEANIEIQSSETNIEQSVSTEENDEMGDDSSDNEVDYFLKLIHLKI